MPIPGFEEFMLPILILLSNGKEFQKKDIKNHLIEKYNISEEEQKEMIKSGRTTVFLNRSSWALSYLKHAGLLSSSKLGYYLITDRGRNALKEKPEKINRAYLMQFPEFISFISPNKEAGKEKTNLISLAEPIEDKDPQELIESGYQLILNNLYKDILEKLKNCSPKFFEILVVDLLLKMGYGGSFKDAGKAIGQSGDGGIDGIIKEDKLGLDVIYIQAKRWEDCVGRPEIQKFVGALVGHHANKGVFITTATFSKGATEFVQTIQNKVILIDGEMLAQLMVDYDIGVTKLISYDIKRIDNDYFVEE
ncbi:restriction endonuclease [bacterium]|nr:restriction endonuclease [bacterium]